MSDDADRRTDPDLRKRLDDIERRNREQIDRLMSRTFWLLAAIVAVFLITAAWNGYLTAQNSDRAAESQRTATQAKAAAAQAARAARDAHRAVVEIQKQRATSIRAQCEDTNHRHDQTIKTLDQILRVAVRGASPARRQEILASRTSTVLLIGALAPRQDCNALVSRLAGPVG